jgi:hypothetical protein
MSSFIRKRYTAPIKICYTKCIASIRLVMRKLMAFRFDVKTINNLEVASKKMGLPKVEIIALALEKYLEDEVDTQNTLKKFVGSLPVETVQKMSNKVIEQRKMGVR